MLPALTILYSSLFLLVGSLKAQSQQAKTSLYFHHPVLIEGEFGQVGAAYKFTGVISASNGQALTDCVVRIEAISEGVELKSIDLEESNQLAAFEPVVEHQQTIGAASVCFSFEFKPHDPATNMDGKYIFPALAASLSGLKGLEDAQAFAECAIGKNGRVWLNKEAKNVLIARNGDAFRAQYKWSTEEEPLSLSSTPIVFANQDVSGFKLKMGVNSKGSPYRGRSVYNLVLTETVPVNHAGNAVHFASLVKDIDMLPEWIGEDAVTTIQDTNKIRTLKKMPLSNDLLVFIPDEMVQKKVVINIYNQKGELRRKIIEEKAPQQLLVEIGDLAAGSYKIEVQSDEKKFTMLTIRSSQL
jgi:hypothetical protein